MERSANSFRHGVIKVNNFGLLRQAFILLLIGVMVFKSHIAIGASGTMTQVIAAGPGNSIILKSDGTVWGLGYDEYGETGHGLLMTYANGSAIPPMSLAFPIMLDSGGNIIAVASGGLGPDTVGDYYDVGDPGLHTLMLRNDGLVLACGDNKHGQLGDGTVKVRLDSIIVTNLANVVAIAAGGYHSLALKADGTVWAWGYNSSGQLGIGNKNSQTVPMQVTSLSGVVAIAAGGAHSLALKSDGTVWTWGVNSRGEIGDGTTTARIAPVKLVNLSNIIAIASSRNHSLALKSDGTVWAWGENTDGQIGNGNTVSPQKIPVQVTNLTNVTAIAAGGYHSLALKSDGTAWAWGRNTHGEIGNGNRVSPTIPVQVKNLIGVVGIAAGEYHSLGLLANGTIFGWGENEYSTIGAGDVSSSGVNSTPIPVNMSFTYSYVNKSLAASPAFDSAVAEPDINYESVMTKTDGTTWSFGYNGLGSLGDGTTYSQSRPEQIDYLAGVVQTAAGGSHTLALKQDGSVWGWGANDSGQLSDGTTIDRISPVEAISNQYPSASLPAGLISWWRGEGDANDMKGNHNGQLQGNVGFATGQMGQCFNFSGDSLDEIAVADAQDFTAMTNAFTIEGWIFPKAYRGTLISRGNNSGSWDLDMDTTNNIHFEIIDVHNNHADILAPVQLNEWQHIAATWNRTNGNMMLYVNGALLSQTNTTVVPVGALDADEAGIGVGNLAVPGPANTGINKANAPDPFNGMIDELAIYSQSLSTSDILATYGLKFLPQYLSGIKQVSAGGQHSLCVGTNGTVWSWGYNGFGQLGDGTTANLYMATNLTTLTGITNVSAGGQHSLALGTNGTVWGWGDNIYGQVGGGAYTNHLTPFVISGLPVISAISAGDFHSLALGTNGNVYAWGENYSGQIGNGTGTNQPTPIHVPGLPSIIEIGAGNQFSAALATNGTVWTWGLNASGQLGDGTTINRLTPVQVIGLTNVTAIQVFSDHIVAVMPDSSVRVWGANTYGQLGIGSEANQTVPVTIPGFYITQPSFVSSTLNNLATNATRYVRGTGNDFTYKSFVIPLDFENGVKLDNTGNNSENFNGSQPWFTLIANDTRHHIGWVSAVTNVDNSVANTYAWNIDFQNPIVAFGSSAGGSSLKIDQPYRFGVYAGCQYENTNSSGAAYISPLRILVYRELNQNESREALLPKGSTSKSFAFLLCGRVWMKCVSAPCGKSFVRFVFPFFVTNLTLACPSFTAF